MDGGRPLTDPPIHRFFRITFSSFQLSLPTPTFNSAFQFSLPIQPSTLRNLPR